MSGNGKWFVLSLGILLLLSIAALLIIKKSDTLSPPVEQVEETQKTVLNFPPTTYKNNSSQYILQIPKTWGFKEEETTGESETTFVPLVGTPQYGSTEKVTVKISTDSIETPLITTQTEFDKYYDLPAEDLHNERYYKMSITTLGEEKAIVLLDKMAPGQVSETAWSLIAWSRKNNKNIYINARGERELTDTDIQLMDTLVSSFIWLPTK